MLVIVDGKSYIWPIFTHISFRKGNNLVHFIIMKIKDANTKFYMTSV